MKKRRELDALVNGKSGRRKKKGQHELLRNDTDSSEVEEFAIPPKAVVRKRSGLARLCSTCVAVCGFFLLTACVVAVGGLVWVHVELKREVDSLTMQLQKVKSDRDSSTENLDDIRSWQTDITTRIKSIESQLMDYQGDLETINTQLEDLTISTTSLSKSIATAPQLESLPDTVGDLEQHVASIGSDVNGLRQDMNAAQQELQEVQERLTPLETPSTPRPYVTPVASSPGEEYTQLSQAVTAMNVSIRDQLSLLQMHSDQHMVELESVVNGSARLEHRVALLELHPSTDALDTSNMQAVVEQAVAEAIGGLPQPDDGPSLVAIMEKVDNISLHVQELSSQMELGPEVSSEQVENLSSQISLHTSEMSQQMGSLNASLGEVQHRVSSLESQVQYLDSQLPAQTAAKPQLGGSNTQSPEVPAEPTEQAVPNFPVTVPPPVGESVPELQPVATSPPQGLQEDVDNDERDMNPAGEVSPTPGL